MAKFINDDRYKDLMKCLNNSNNNNKINKKIHTYK